LFVLRQEYAEGIGLWGNGKGAAIRNSIASYCRVPAVTSDCDERIRIRTGSFALGRVLSAFKQGEKIGTVLLVGDGGAGLDFLQDAVALGAGVGDGLIHAFIREDAGHFIVRGMLWELDLEILGPSRPPPLCAFYGSQNRDEVTDYLESISPMNRRISRRTSSTCFCPLIALPVISANRAPGISRAST
jgi:hypothetical protein